jgi:hypothetical protein
MQKIMMNKIIPISKKARKKTTVGSISSPCRGLSTGRIKKKSGAKAVLRQHATTLA